MWCIDEDDLVPDAPDVRSTIFAVGNGRMCTRGTLPEERFGAYRGVYVSGLYTVAPFGLAYFMPAPDWLPVLLRIGDEPAVPRSSRRELDLGAGLLRRTAVFAAGADRIELREERLVSWAFPHLAGQRIELRRLSGEAPIEVALGLDGEVRQSPAKYYRPGQVPACDEAGLRLTAIEELAADADGLAVTLVSPQVGRRARASATVRHPDADDDPEPVYTTSDGRALARYRLPADGDAERIRVFEKLCLVTCDLEGVEGALRDGDLLSPVLRETSYAAARADHVARVRAFWDEADVAIAGDPSAQRAVRFALWSTRCAAVDDGGLSSLGAKNLTGDWYQGAVFWDMEAYQLPLLTAVAPDLARNHLRYRCRRLDASRSMAARDGYRGARYAGMSYASGFEEPPRAAGSLGALEIHVSLEVAWGMLHHLDATGDLETVFAGGLAVVLEVSRFWASRVERDPDGSWHLRGICGPDELHKPVDDNTYSNAMVRELLARAEGLIERCARSDALRTAAILAATGVDDGERRRWREVVTGLLLPRRDDGLLEQFHGHDRLPEPNPVRVADRGMGADRVGKQADTLMLLQMIPWTVPPAEQEALYREYAPLCNQTSSLSLCTHALIAARLGLAPDAERYFDWAAGVDLDDSMGNAAYGIHAAGEGGIWLVAVAGFGGLTLSPDGLDLAPLLPPGWESLRYRYRYRGSRLELLATPGELSVENRGPEDASFSVEGRETTLAAGRTERYPLTRRWRDPGLGGVVVDLPAAGGPAAERLAALLPELAASDAALAAVGPEAPADSAGGSGPWSTVVDRTVSRRVKPDPQAYLVATQRLRVLPWNCVGLAADAAGVAAIHGAGMAAVAIVPGPAVADADAVLDADAGSLLDQLHAARAAHLPTINPYLARNREIVTAEATVASRG